MTDETPPPFAPGPHEEEAWTAFAAHALAGYASRHLLDEDGAHKAVRLSAFAADLMLDELRERRQP